MISNNFLEKVSIYDMISNNFLEKVSIYGMISNIFWKKVFIYGMISYHFFIYQCPYMAFPTISLKKCSYII